MTGEQLEQAELYLTSLKYGASQLLSYGLGVSKLYDSLYDISKQIEKLRKSISDTELIIKGQLYLDKYNDDADYILYVKGLNMPLAEYLESKISRKFVTIRYYITDRECTIDEAQKHYLDMVLGKSEGTAETSFGSHYSELTGYLWTDEEVVVGGHDLIKRLKTHLNKYLILEIVIHHKKKKK